MIEVKNITKKYGDTAVVDNISFEVNDHEIVGFLGPNGAGKSTTMNMITGYIEPTKGKIIVNGYDIKKSPIKAKRQIGYMPESVPLYNDLTVKEFIAYMADLRSVKHNKKEEINKIMDQTGLSKVQNKLIKNISRGYKQRVSLAGALIGNPDVLILDEPTVGLDPKQITEIRSLIKELGKNHTVILSSHILSEVSQICEKVVIINKGKILAVDTPENLEKKTKEENSILLTVEDKESKMKNVSKKIDGAKKVKLVKENDDGTTQYLIVSDKDVDIRKNIFEILPKENISIFELKQNENTLEDAFLQIINEKDKEAKRIEEKKAKRQAEIAKMDKKERKEAIKEDKKKEKQEKEEKLEAEYERDRAIEQAEKDEKSKIKETKKAIKKQNKYKGGNNRTAEKKENPKVVNTKKENDKKETNKNYKNKNYKYNSQRKKQNNNNQKNTKVNNSNPKNNRKNKGGSK